MTRMRLVISLVFMIVAAWMTQVSAQEHDKSELVRSLKSLTPDPSQDLGIHYVVTNEIEHDLFEPVVRGLGGAYIGVGTNQNFALISWMRPEFVIFMDFDQTIVDLHEIYRLIFLRAETPEAFISFWSKEKQEDLRKLVSETFTDKKIQRRMLKVLKISNRAVRNSLRKTRRRYKRKKIKTYITDLEHFTFLRSLYLNGNVVAVRGDLAGRKSVRAIGDILRKNKVTVRAAYISNCEQYFAFTEDYKANIAALPVDEKSYILRTRAWKEFLPGTREPKGNEYYTFIAQTFDDFSTWLAGGTAKVRDMIGLKRYRDKLQVVKSKRRK